MKISSRLLSRIIAETIRETLYGKRSTKKNYSHLFEETTKENLELSFEK